MRLINNDGPNATGLKDYLFLKEYNKLLHKSVLLGKTSYWQENASIKQAVMFISQILFL